MKDQVIENYQRDEEMMILIFAQWCINNDLDPIEIYKRAYPVQMENELLKKAIGDTVSKEEADHIPLDTLFTVLSLYGNEELAFVVSAVVEKKA